MTAATITIRELAPADVSDVTEIQRAAPEAAQWSPSDYESLARSAGGLVMVAESHGGGSAARLTIGFAAARSTGAEAELQNLAVHPAFRRRGVAGRLTQDVHERLAAAGVGRIFLEVRASNVAALGLYRRLGYAQVGVRREYYGSDGEDALILELPLSAAADRAPGRPQS